MRRRILFAFSGGIEDVISVHWLRHNRGFRVIALLANIGQPTSLDQVGELALETGADETRVVDLRRDFVENYIFPALLAGARYEDYLLATPLARYAISAELVRVAAEEGIETVGHGSSMRGNDQVRFVTSTSALAPELDIVAPLAEMALSTHREKLEFLRRLRLPVRPEFESDVSLDANLWGCGQVYGDLSDPWRSPGEDLSRYTRNYQETPDEPAEITLGFERGVPRQLDDENTDPVELILKLNMRGGEHGVGRLDHVENRLLGGKSREFYEAPAAQILYQAHAALEELTQPRDLWRCQKRLGEEYGRLVYEGLWFSELRQALDRFFEEAQRFVTGRVRLQLFKGHASIQGRESEYSLYERQLTESREGQERLRRRARGVVELHARPREQRNRRR